MEVERGVEVKHVLRRAGGIGLDRGIARRLHPRKREARVSAQPRGRQNGPRAAPEAALPEFVVNI